MAPAWALLAAAGCGKAPPAAAPGAEAVTRAEERVAELEGDLRLAARRVERLEETREAAERERDAAWTEAVRFRAGLERCVAELNAVPRQGAVSRSGRPEPAAAPPGESARLLSLAPPVVQMVDDRVQVSATVWNFGAADSEAEIEIELLRDSEVVDSARQVLVVPAGTSRVVSATFRVAASGVPGSWSARVRF